MGRSTTAMVAFGFDLGEDLPEAWEGLEFDDIIAQENGLEQPPPESHDNSKWSNYFTTLGQLADAYPLELIYHCSCDYPLHFLALKGTQQWADRGYPALLEQLPPIEPDAITQMKDFCARHNINWQEPGWYLFSNEG